MRPAVSHLIRISCRVAALRLLPRVSCCVKRLSQTCVMSCQHAMTRMSCGCVRWTSPKDYVPRFFAKAQVQANSMQWDLSEVLLGAHGALVCWVRSEPSCAWFAGATLVPDEDITSAACGELPSLMGRGWGRGFYMRPYIVDAMSLHLGCAHLWG